LLSHRQRGGIETGFGEKERGGLGKGESGELTVKNKSRGRNNEGHSSSGGFPQNKEMRGASAGSSEKRPPESS